MIYMFVLWASSTRHRVSSCDEHWGGALRHGAHLSSHGHVGPWLHPATQQAELQSHAALPRRHHCMLGSVMAGTLLKEMQHAPTHIDCNMGQCNECKSSYLQAPDLAPPSCWQAIAGMIYIVTD